MASAVLANPTRALQGTNRGSGPAMEVSKNDVRNLEKLLLYLDEHYLAGKWPLGDLIGKILHGVEEYHQRNVGKWTGYHRLCPPKPLHQLCGQCHVEQCGRNCTSHQGASTPIHGYHLSPKQTGTHY
ncbi:15-hydroxyprostaglandin dehydrogenase [Trichonephila clavipes]|nr:15-hydroxyprostaglandin dehydrogenase [Trichonephila clavipes]